MKEVVDVNSLMRAMESADNLYLDLSALSGYNALTRDPAFTQGFVARHWQRMLLGTDIVHASDKLPVLDWLRTLDVPTEWRYAIAEANARRVLGMGEN